MQAMHIERKGTHEQIDHPKRNVATKRRRENPSCTHCDKEGYDEENFWNLYPELRPKRNDKKGKQKIATTIQQNQYFESKEEEKAIAIGFA